LLLRPFVRSLSALDYYARYNKYEPWRNRQTKTFSHGVERREEADAPFFTVSTSLTQVPAPPIPTPVPFYSPQAVAARQAAN
jgi:hypothetical protein